MNKNLNLCEILRGHEGEIFWSPAYGRVTLVSIKENAGFPISVKGTFTSSLHEFTSDGKMYNLGEAECILFPSKDQRSWEKWIDSQKSKTPKTWSEIKDNKHIKDYCIAYHSVDGVDYDVFINSLIEKSALALLKIYQLIEIGYGGIVYEPNEPQSIILWDYRRNKPHIETFSRVFRIGNLIRLKPGMAEEFLSYSENIELLKDYFMV